ETGWYYLQSRYYDPITCRFISADVLLSTGQGVIGHNSFAYCLNNPLNRCDPNGMSSF
ncbi:MAG: RHS repeat-associated core domain-containing protein, partial [Lachnospiraceae bacterium]|nr:RHS repeat-associated core domain-containing protein [Lachnospiraceae bacterium]